MNSSPRRWIQRVALVLLGMVPSGPLGASGSRASTPALEAWGLHPSRPTIR